LGRRTRTDVGRSISASRLCEEIQEGEPIPDFHESEEGTQDL